MTARLHPSQYKTRAPRMAGTTYDKDPDSPRKRTLVQWMVQMGLTLVDVQREEAYRNGGKREQTEDVPDWTALRRRMCRTPEGAAVDAARTELGYY